MIINELLADDERYGLTSS